MNDVAYSLIFLDADDTLFDYARSERFALERAFSSRGLACTEETVRDYGLINKRLWRDYESKLISQETLRAERFRLLFERLRIDVNAGEFSSEYLRWLSRASFLIDGAAELCAYLHDRHTVAVVTNGIAEVQRARISASPIAAYIDHLVISEEAGCSKPDPGIFRYAELKTGMTDRSRMIMVGDSPQSDIQGGINYGIDTCWFNVNGIVNDTGIVATYTIDKLADLASILEGKETA